MPLKLSEDHISDDSL
jgi:hypothetical protein